MQDDENPATRIIDRWPGDTRPQRRQALARSLNHKDEEKVRYWQKSRQIPKREWQGIIDAGAPLGIAIGPEDFVAHLRPATELATTDSAAA